MGRPLRFVKSDRYYFITNRCLAGQYLMRPDEDSIRIILGVLARAVVQHNVRVVCFVFMSNHFHLICRFPKCNMGEFMSQLTGQLSRRLNKLRGRSGPMFPKRYHDQMLMGPGALTDKIQYVVNNPVKDGLVADARNWPGVHSIDAQLGDGTVTGEWYNGTKYHQMKQRGEGPAREDAFEEFTFELDVPECLDGADKESRKETILAAITEHKGRIWELETGYKDEPPDVLGDEAVCEASWRTRDGYQDRNALPDTQKLKCWSRSPGAIRQFYEDHKRRTERYRRAAQLRKKGKHVSFPEGMYPPGEVTVWTWKRANLSDEADTKTSFQAEA